MDSVVWRAAVAGVETVSMACAALNFGYFVWRAFAFGSERLSRRVAALVLAVMSLGAFSESVVALAWVLASSHDGFPIGLWALARALPVAGTVGVSALVLKRVSSE